MKMRDVMRRLTAVAMLFWLTAFSSAPAAAQLRVVATTTDVTCLADSVGGSLVTVTSIGTGREDVHMLAAKPSFMVQANRADLWIRQGLELEIGFEPLVIEGARNPDIHPGRRGHLDVSRGVHLLDVPTGPVDRSMGDVHPMGNPHYHLDPLNGRIMARNILDRLVELDPDNRETFTKNYQAFIERLDRAMFGDEAAEAVEAERLWSLHTAGTLDALLEERDLPAGGWHALLAPWRGTRLVTYHRSWGYFARRFGLVVVDELEPKPGIPPSPRHLASLVARMQALDVKVILMEPFYSRRAPDLVAERTGAVVVEVGNMVGSEPAASDYIRMIDNIVRRMAEALEGQP